MHLSDAGNDRCGIVKPDINMHIWALRGHTSDGHTEIQARSTLFQMRSCAKSLASIQFRERRICSRLHDSSRGSIFLASRRQLPVAMVMVMKAPTLLQCLHPANIAKTSVLAYDKVQLLPSPAVLEHPIAQGRTVEFVAGVICCAHLVSLSTTRAART